MGGGPTQLLQTQRTSNTIRFLSGPRILRECSGSEANSRAHCLAVTRFRCAQKENAARCFCPNSRSPSAPHDWSTSSSAGGSSNSHSESGRVRAHSRWSNGDITATRTVSERSASTAARTTCKPCGSAHPASPGMSCAPKRQYRDAKATKVKPHAPPIHEIKISHAFALAATLLPPRGKDMGMRARTTGHPLSRYQVHRRAPTRR